MVCNSIVQQIQKMMTHDKSDRETVLVRRMLQDGLLDVVCLSIREMLLQLCFDTAAFFFPVCLLPFQLYIPNVFTSLKYKIPELVGSQPASIYSKEITLYELIDIVSSKPWVRFPFLGSTLKQQIYIRFAEYTCCINALCFTVFDFHEFIFNVGVYKCFNKYMLPHFIGSYRNKMISSICSYIPPPKTIASNKHQKSYLALSRDNSNFNMLEESKLVC
ncbi:calcium-dependent protein kinase 26 [Gossypium australe]|uniref:Calcium-dependent protein kinase 26 n=1 Tax=Gossypium australe TaxID=47621 RepID=A0A5B6WMS6_9ROSI|nr:calcium-dependent protein kinase 26 [Gossypium australe]